MNTGFQLPTYVQGLLLAMAVVAFSAPFVANGAVTDTKVEGNPVVTIEHCYT